MGRSANLALAILAALFFACPAQAAGGYGYDKCSTGNFWKAAVPDEKTAIAIAENVSVSQGARPLAAYRPFAAHLDGNVWRVTSARPLAPRKPVTVAIDRCDGTVKLLAPG